MKTATILNMHPAIEVKDSRKAVLTLDFGKPFAEQVEDYLKGLGDIRQTEKVILVGQSVGAALVLPAMEMIAGMPSIGLHGFGQDAKLLGYLDIEDYRHNVVRPCRSELVHGEAFAGYTVLDGGGRGLTPLQLAELAQTLGVEETQIMVLDINMGQVDFAVPQQGMVKKLLSLGLTKADWLSGRILHLPAGSGLVAAVMATTIYGLTEVWSRTIRLNRESDGQFHLAEIVDPQSMRQFGVKLCGELEAATPTVTLTGNIPKEFHEVLVKLAQKHGVEVRG